MLHQLIMEVRFHQLITFVYKLGIGLDPPEPSSNYNAALRTSDAARPEMVVEGEQFLTWMEAVRSFLWIHGIYMSVIPVTWCLFLMENAPVSGKSVLWSAHLSLGNIKLMIYILSSTIEAVKNKCGHDSSARVCVISTSISRTPAKQNYRSLLCSLIIQLSGRFASIPSTLQGLYSQNHNGIHQPTPDALLMVLKELCRPFEHTYIVMDALDECTGPERSDVLCFIETLVGWGFEQRPLAGH